jgi:hypothetical protein
MAQHPLQRGARRSDAPLDGGQRAAAQGGHGLDLLALDVAQGPGQPVVHRYLIQKVVDAREQRPLLGAAAGRGEVLVAARLVEAEEGADAALAQVAAGLAHRDGLEPAADGGRGVHARQPAHGVEEDLLHDVVDLVVAAEHAQHHGGDEARVVLEQLLQLERRAARRQRRGHRVQRRFGDHGGHGGRRLTARLELRLDGLRRLSRCRGARQEPQVRSSRGHVVLGVSAHGRAKRLTPRAQHNPRPGRTRCGRALAARARTASSRTRPRYWLFCMTTRR